MLAAVAFSRLACHGLYDTPARPATAAVKTD